MITDVCALDQSLLGMQDAFKLTERCAAYCGLDTHQTLQLRLLTEELLGMMRGILGNYDAQFYLETQPGNNITIHLKAHADIDIPETERKKIVEISSKGENVAYRGIMGKVRKLLECGMFGGEASLAAAGGMMFTGLEYDTYMLPGQWSLKQYVSAVEASKDKAAQEWDELEKSIVAKIADDVIVSVHADEAQISIRKQFV